MGQLKYLDGHLGHPGGIIPVIGAMGGHDNVCAEKIELIYPSTMAPVTRNDHTRQVLFVTVKICRSTQVYIWRYHIVLNRNL